MPNAFDTTYQPLDPRTPGYVPETGLGEKISSIWALTNSEYLGRSAADAWTDKLKERRLKIQELTGEKVDLITPMTRNLMGPDPTLGFPVYEEPREDFRLANGMSIREFAAKNDAVFSDDEIWELIENEKKEIRDNAADVSRRASGFTNVTGTLIGGFAASLRDPAILLSMTLGAGVSTSLIRTALLEGGIAGAAELVIQPNIIRFQRGLGQDVGLTDAAKNIAFVAGAAAIFGGTLKGVTLLPPVRRWLHPATRQSDELLTKLAQADVEMSPEVQLAFRFLDEHNEIVSRNPFPINDPASAPNHAHMIGRTTEAFDEYRSADYTDTLNHRTLGEMNPDMVADANTVKAFEKFRQQRFPFVDEFDNQYKELQLAVASGDPILKDQANLAFRDAQKLDVDIPTIELVGDEFKIVGSRKSKEILREALEDEKAATRLKVCQLGGGS